MQEQTAFGRRVAAREAAAANRREEPDLSLAYREFSAGLNDKRNSADSVRAFFGGARGAIIALGGCTALIGIFLIVWLRGFARFADGNLTMLMVGGAVLLLVLPRLLPLLGRKR